MSDTSCPKCGDVKGSCAAPATPATVQNGKGDAPRNMSRSFRSNFEGIQWGSPSKKKSTSATMTKKKSSR